MSVAGLKGTEGPRPAAPESFKVKALHLVSVLIDHRHIISPVQGLICPLNQHLLSTAAVVCWRGGNWKGLIIPGRCESEPIFCSLLSCLLVDFVFSDTRFPKHRGIWWALTVGGKNIFKDKSEIENATLKKCKLYFIYLLGSFFFFFFTKMAEHASYVGNKNNTNLHKFNEPCRHIICIMYLNKLLVEIT